MMKALILDANYYPIRIVDWQKAMILFFTDRAQVVDYHEDIQIHSSTRSFKLPKVLRLYSKITNLAHIKFNRENLFTRDDYQCQYCYKEFVKKDLTFDHVFPKSRGGSTSWTNIVACCAPCNSKKADKTPKEAGMRLLKKPIEPKWTPFYGLKKIVKSNIFDDWLPF